MNTLQNLIDNGIEINTAIRMLSDYQNRISTDNGIYTITDITYDFNERGKDVTLVCRNCGREVHRIMKSGRNKWSELIKNCPCSSTQRQKLREEKLRLKKIESQKIFENKKAALFESAKEMVGETYGDFKITGAERIKDGVYVSLCCEMCGEKKTVPFSSIKNNVASHKRCKNHYNPIKYNESYIGRKKNFLTVIGITRDKSNHRVFLCECDCGNTKTVEPIHWDRETIKSCGCLHDSQKLEHSEELDRLRRIHNGMIQRCYNKNCDAYINYGGRGISICPEWHDREVFIEWALSHGYSNELSIDRINVNGNYEPSNCRWADQKTQTNNRRPRSEWSRPPKERKKKSKVIDGIEKPIVEWYLIYGVTGPTVAYRMKTFGLSFEEALKMKKLTEGRPRKR